MSFDNNQDNELDLLAFRYAAAEMAGEELQQFELRLAEEQEVREAVASAVQIAQAVAYAQHSVDGDVHAAKEENPTWRARRLWVVVASSAAVAFLAGVGIARWFDSSSTNSQPLVASRDVVPGPAMPELAGTQVLNGATNQVVALWSASATEFGKYTEDNALVDGDEAIAATAVTETWDSNDEDAFNVPSWMLAAVSSDDASEDSALDSMPEEN